MSSSYPDLQPAASLDAAVAVQASFHATYVVPGPIYTLPTELLQYIFILALGSTRIKQNLVAILRVVCRSWYGIIDSNPIFWREIYLCIHSNIKTDREESLKTRLARYTNFPIEVEIYVGGAAEHNQVCLCGLGRGWCDVLKEYRRSFLQFLRILAGRNGLHMKRWVAFRIDQYTEWSRYKNVLTSNITDLGKSLNHPTPLLERLEIWGISSRNPMFPDAPRLHTVWLKCAACELQSFKNVRRVRMDCQGEIPWDLLRNVEALTIEASENHAPDTPMDISFGSLRRLALLGSAHYSLLDLVKECPLDSLVVRVSHAEHLERIIECLPLEEIKDIVLGGFSKVILFRPHPTGYPEANQRRQLRAFASKTHGLHNVKLLGQNIVGELNRFGVDTRGVPCYRRTEGDDPLDDMYSWSEDEDWFFEAARNSM
ncbi:hypothetical protein FRC17_000766 [Serendipita sp. 399]|nr:hypothetical protein FRC17_000766 [Serendipita sp. 399]